MENIKIQMNKVWRRINIKIDTGCEEIAIVRLTIIVAKERKIISGCSL